MGILHDVAGLFEILNRLSRMMAQLLYIPFHVVVLLTHYGWLNPPTTNLNISSIAS